MYSIIQHTAGTYGTRVHSFCYNTFYSSCLWPPLFASSPPPLIDRLRRQSFRVLLVDVGRFHPRLSATLRSGRRGRQLSRSGKRTPAQRVNTLSPQQREVSIPAGGAYLPGARELPRHGGARYPCRGVLPAVSIPDPFVEHHRLVIFTREKEGGTASQGRRSGGGGGER